jgi:hypothetical protein
LWTTKIPKTEEKNRVDSVIDMGDYSLGGFRWLEDKGDLDLKLNYYHQASAETARRTASVPEPIVRHPSRCKTSLLSLSIRRGRSSTSSSRHQIEPSRHAVLRSKPRQIRSSSLAPKHICSRASVSSIDPHANHYEDPAARMKLRLYLASPQKFDDAIEGSPSVEERKRRGSIRPMTIPKPRPEASRTFFLDDTPSLSGDDGDDADEPDTIFDPRTPEEAVFQMHNPDQKGIGDSNNRLRPFSARRQPETYARWVATDGEMTLRITLTRPDLRSPEEKQLNHTKNINAIPLKRPELTVEGKPPVLIWDTLPTEESRVMRFLQRLKLK